MGKVILEFDSIEEQIEIEAAINGIKWKMAMIDFDQKLRETTKYGTSVLSNNEASDIEFEIAEKYREFLREILDEHGLNFDY